MQVPKTGILPADSYLQTVRIHYSAKKSKKNISIGLEDVVHAAIFLGKDQVGLAVEPNRVHRVYQRFVTFNYLRLLSGDPSTHPSPIILMSRLVALHSLRCFKNTARKLIIPCSYVQCFDGLIMHYQKQCQF
jgi:hypothetical protein